MKLHLPRALRTALLACITAVAGLTTTVGSGFVAGGVVAFTLVAQQAKAEAFIYYATTGNSTGNGALEIPGVTKLNVPQRGAGEHEDKIFSDGVTLTMSSKQAKDSYWNNNEAWTNESVLTEMNNTLGIGVTAADVTGMSSFGAWGGGANTDIKLDFDAAKWVAGTEVVFYAFGSNILGEGTQQTFSITGLQDGSVTKSATANGSGFDDTVSSFQNKTLYKVTGKLTGDLSVTLNNGAAKNGWGLVAYAGKLYWCGDTGEAWSDSKWGIAADSTDYISFANGWIASFGGDTATVETVNVTAATEVASMEITGGNYTFNLTDSLTTKGLIQIAEGASLVVTGTGALELSNPIDVAAGATLNLDGATLNMLSTSVLTGNDVVFKKGEGDTTVQEYASKLYTGEGTVTGTATISGVYTVTDGVVSMGSEQVSENTTYVMNDPSITSNIVIEDGITLQARQADEPSNQALPGRFGLQLDAAPDRTITVEKGGTIDMNGCADQMYHITLAGGTLSNTGGEISTGFKQTPKITLTADSTVSTDTGFGLLNGGYAATYLTLKGHTLTKTGSGKFLLCNTDVDSGKIIIEGGTVLLWGRDGLNLNGNLTVETATGASLKVEGNNVDNNGALTVNGTLEIEQGNLENVAGSTITVDGTYDEAGVLVEAGKFALKSNGYITNYGTLNLGTVTVETVHEGALGGTVNMKGAVNFTRTGLAVIDENAKWTMYDGSSITTANYCHFKGSLSVEKDATATFTSQDDFHLGHATQNACSITLNENSTLNFVVLNEGKGIETHNNAVVNLKSGSTLNLQQGIFKLSVATLGEEGKTSTIKLSGGSLQLNSGGAQTVYSTISADKADGGTSILRNNAGAESMQRNLSSLHIAANNTLELQQNHWNTIWNIGKLSGEGDLLWSSATNHNNTSRLVLTGDNSDFKGELSVNRTYDSDANRVFQAYVELANNNALVNSTVSFTSEATNPQNARTALAVNTDNAQVKGLNGDAHAHIYAGAAVVSAEGTTVPQSTRANTTLTVNGDGEYTFAGSVGTAEDTNRINLSMVGTGTQEFSGAVYANKIHAQAGTLNMSDTCDVKQVEVENGATLSIAAGLSSSVGSVDLAAGSTLNTALMLNGGSLTLDTTGVAASLADNTLVLGTGTTLNLTLTGDEKKGSTLTLLSSIGSIYGQNEGSLGLLGDYFTLGTIVDQSALVATIAEEEDVNSWAERLSRSELFFSDGSLYLELAENIFSSDPLYWEPNTAGNGNWSGASWAETDGATDDPGVIQTSWPTDEEPPSVEFTGHDSAETPAEVIVDTNAVVTDMLVENGAYTFTEGDATTEADAAGSLEVKGTLTIGENGSATLDVATKVKHIELTDSSSALTVNKQVTMTEGGSWTATNGGTITNALENEQSLVIKNAKLGGVATKTDDELEGNGLKLTGGSFAIIDSTLTGQIDNSDCSGIQLGGTIVVDTIAMGDLIEGKVTTYHDQTGSEVIGEKNGYTKEAMQAQLFTSGGVIGDPLEGVTWEMIDGVGQKVAASVTPDTETEGLYNIGTLHPGTEYVAADKDTAAVYNAENKLFSERATALVLDGGSFILQSELGTAAGTTDPLKIRAEAGGGTVTIGDGVTLDQESLVVNKNTITIQGDEGAVYQLTYEEGSGSTELLANVAGLTDAEGWQGTVNVGMLVGGTADLSQLGNANSTVAADDLTLDSIIAGDTGLVDVEKDATLDGGDSTVNNMVVGGNVTVGEFEKSSLTADSLTVNGAEGINVGDGSSATVDGLLDVTEGNVTVGDGSTLDAGSITVNGTEGISLGDGSSATVDGLVDVTAGDVIIGAGTTVKAGAMNVGGGMELGDNATVNVIMAAAARTTDAAPEASGNLTVTKDLVLGKGATVSVDNELSVGGVIDYTTLDTEKTQITTATLRNDSLDISLDKQQMRDAAKAVATSVGDTNITLATLMEVTNGSAAEVDLNELGSDTWNPYAEKYGYTVAWDTTETLLQLSAVANENYMKQKYDNASPNGLAGATIMDDAFASGAIATGGELEKILEGVDNNVITDKDLASVAGSSTAALGMALAGDVERQLRAIRNRTTTMGVDQCVVNEGMPYFNAWVNAEGNLSELDQDGTYAGYSLDSWGGTIGFDVDVNPSLTLGLAVTAMYGDLTVDGPDMLDGDMDTYYVSAFARYASRAWTHTFVGTVGMMDGSYERTVSHANGSYKTEGDTEGMAFALMYEVGRVYAITKDGDACWQPVFNVAYRHTAVDGYKESGPDAALNVDDQTLDTITFGAGARLQAVVGENLYNRTSVLELRALAKLDVGDRSSEADVAFIGGGRAATVESAELGAFGVELGAGLSIPMGDEDSGSLFFDVSAELRSGYSNLNGTVGYRINF